MTLKRAYQAGKYWSALDRPVLEGYKIGSG
jgi:hypothetical protein